MDNVGKLEDEALKRKERLKALREGQLKSLNQNNEENGDLFPKPLFRNYNPKDEDLKSNVLPKPDLTEIRNEIKDQLDSGKPKSLIEKEIDLATLAPQKIDWDLKRDCEKKLKLLERRTQKAIVELIRDRLRGNKNSDLAELVTVGSRDLNKSQGEESESDDDDDDDDENDVYEKNNSNNFVENEATSSSNTESKNVYIYEQHEISDDEY